MGQSADKTAPLGGLIKVVRARLEPGYRRVALQVGPLRKVLPERLRDTRSIDLLLVKDHAGTPPVKYEAFTYPGADHLLSGSENGGGNTYVYAHARTGMFWNLHNAHIGDVVVVDYGSGKSLRYRISEIHPKIYW